MAEKRKWIVTSSGARPLEHLKTDLLQLGFQVENTMDEIGVIAGTAEAAVAGKVRRVKGVADVSPDQDVDIGPPGSDKAW